MENKEIIKLLSCFTEVERVQCVIFLANCLNATDQELSFDAPRLPAEISAKLLQVLEMIPRHTEYPSKMDASSSPFRTF